MSMFPHAAVSAAGTTRAKYQVGGLYTSPEGAIFRYVRAEDAAIAVGDVLCYGWNGADSNWEVTNTSTSAIDSALATVNICAGVAVGAIADASFGFVQVSGLCGDVTCDTGVAAGDNIVVNGGATPDGTGDTAIAGEEGAIFALALAADVASSVDCILRGII